MPFNYEEEKAKWKNFLNKDSDITHQRLIKVLDVIPQPTLIQFNFELAIVSLSFYKNHGVKYKEGVRKFNNPILPDWMNSDGTVKNTMENLLLIIDIYPPDFSGLGLPYDGNIIHPMISTYQAETRTTNTFENICPEFIELVKNALD